MQNEDKSTNLSNSIPNFCGNFTEKQLNKCDNAMKKGIEDEDKRKGMIVSRIDTITIDYYFNKNKCDHAEMQKQREQRKEKRKEHESMVKEKEKSQR